VEGSFKNSLQRHSDRVFGGRNNQSADIFQRSRILWNRFLAGILSQNFVNGQLIWLSTPVQSDLGTKFARTYGNWISGCWGAQLLRLGTWLIISGIRQYQPASPQSTKMNLDRNNPESLIKGSREALFCFFETEGLVCAAGRDVLRRHLKEGWGAMRELRGAGGPEGWGPGELSHWFF